MVETLGSDPKFDHLFKNLFDIYNEHDSNVWTLQVNDKDYVQSRCMPANSDVV